MSVSDDDISALLNSELLERRTKVMFLRNAGATWKAIAAECEVSEATARKDYQVVCRDINNEQPANVVARHRAVIYDIQRANYPAMMRGNVKAAAVILKALDRESRLLGLDAPTRILAGVSDIEFANEAARLIERIQALDPTTLKELERGHQLIDAEAQHSRIIDAEPVDPPAGDGPPADQSPSPGEAVPAGGSAGGPDQSPGGDRGSADAAGDGGRADAGSHVDPAEPDHEDDDWSNI